MEIRREKMQIIKLLFFIVFLFYNLTFSDDNIPLYDFGNSKKVIFIVGGIHGNEPESAILSHLLLEKLKEDSSNLKYKVLIAPEINRYGLEHLQRKNKNNIDINRNFPTKDFGKISALKANFFGGTRASSELETKFLMEIMENYSPILVITLHAGYNNINYDGPAKKAADFLSKFSGLKVVDYIGYPTPGSFGSYYGIEKKVPVITYELKSSNTNYIPHLLAILNLLETTEWEH